jgi:NDP-sugar pyrophosphorylase family protein
MAEIRYAIVMAAGRGMRMMPLTEDLPKAMAPYNGSTLIANGIEKIKTHIPNIYITVGYKGSMLAKHVIEHNVSGILNTEGQDNSWWIFNTLCRYIDEPVLVLTCDNVVELDYQELLINYMASGSPSCMVVPVKPIAGLSGDYIFRDSNRRVTQLSRTEVSDIYCSGIQILNPSKINKIMTPKDNFYEVWMKLIDLGELYCSNTYPSKWFAVDTMEQLRLLGDNG